MPRFFIGENQIDGNTVTLTGEDAHHIARSLRMAVGDEVTVCDPNGQEYRCIIEGFEEDRTVRADILTSVSSECEPVCRVTLFQALPKGDKLDSIIQKAVECGVWKIVPFESERCVARIKAENEARKGERRKKIAAEAAKQCGRGRIPEVEPAISFDSMLREAQTYDLCLFCYEGKETEPLGRILAETPRDNACRIAVIIGSEGGFSEAEAEKARKLGMRMTGLGKRILRTETAPIFVLSCIVCNAELR